MKNVFEIVDKTGRKIHLSKKQWIHIKRKHPEIQVIEILEETIQNPDKITIYNFDESVHYYYKYFKHLKSQYRFLCVAVKYLNGEGYIITSYFDKRVK